MNFFIKSWRRISDSKLKIEKRLLCNFKWCGSKYGGFYIHPELINENSIVYSFGVGEDISFDLEMIQNHNCFVYGFDPTPKSINWIKTQKLPVNFQFFEYGISNKSGIADFYLPLNPDFVSGSLIKQKNVDSKQKIRVFMKNLNEIVNDLGHAQIDVLKMDIEGAEYDVIDSIIHSNVTINQLLIEFHHRFITKGKAKTRKAIKKLKSYGYEVFAFSDTCEEVSFVFKNILNKCQ